MSLHKAMKQLKLDKRLIEWNLRNGQLTQDELKKHLDSLPDLKDKVDIVNLSSTEDRSQFDSH